MKFGYATSEAIMWYEWLWCSKSWLCTAQQSSHGHQHMITSECHLSSSSSSKITLFLWKKTKEKKGNTCAEFFSSYASTLIDNNQLVHASLILAFGYWLFVHAKIWGYVCCTFWEHFRRLSKCSKSPKSLSG